MSFVVFGSQLLSIGFYVYYWVYCILLVHVRESNTVTQILYSITVPSTPHKFKKHIKFNIFIWAFLLFRNSSMFLNIIRL